MFDVIRFSGMFRVCTWEAWSYNRSNMQIKSKAGMKKAVPATELKAGLWSIADMQEGDVPEESTRKTCGYLLHLMHKADRRSRINNMLDIPCGKGRHDGAFRKAGLDVFGIDKEPGFVEEAAALSGKPDRYFVGDMRDIAFRDESFDSVANLFTSFSMFPHRQNMKVLREFARVLKPGGLFFMQTVVKSTEPITPKFIDRVGNGVYRKVVNITTKKRWIQKSTLFRKTGKGFRKLASLKIVFRLYDIDELREMCESSGLKVLNIYKNGTTKPATKDNLHVMLVATKTGRAVHKRINK